MTLLFGTAFRDIVEQRNLDASWYQQQWQLQDEIQAYQA
jgi:hypothetical protein